MVVLLMLIVLATVPVVWLLVRQTPTGARSGDQVALLVLLALLTVAVAAVGLVVGFIGAVAFWSSTEPTIGPMLMGIAVAAWLVAAALGWVFTRVLRRGQVSGR